MPSFLLNGWTNLHFHQKCESLLPQSLTNKVLLTFWTFLIALVKYVTFAIFLFTFEYLYLCFCEHCVHTLWPLFYRVINITVSLRLFTYGEDWPLLYQWQVYFSFHLRFCWDAEFFIVFVEFIYLFIHFVASEIWIIFGKVFLCQCHIEVIPRFLVIFVWFHHAYKSFTILGIHHVTK